MPFITQAKTNWKFLLIVIVLAAIVGAGILAYLRTMEITEEPVVEEPVVEELEILPEEEVEIAGWQAYRNEEYGFKVKYPPDYSARGLDRITITKPTGEEGYSAGVKIYLEGDQIYGFPAIGSPVQDTSKISFEEFAGYAAREHCFVKGTMGMAYCDKVIEQTSFMLPGDIKGYEIYVNVVSTSIERDEKWEIIETKSTESEKGPIFALDVAEQTNNELRGIFFEPFITLSDLTKKEEAEKATKDILNEMLLTFRFIEVIPVWPEVEAFDLTNRTFEGKIFEGEVWTQEQKLKILTTDDTKFYRIAEPGWEKEYFTFSEFHSLLENWTGTFWPFMVVGTFEEEGVIKADEIYYITQ